MHALVQHAVYRRAISRLGGTTLKRLRWRPLMEAELPSGLGPLPERRTIGVTMEFVAISDLSGTVG